MILPARRPFMPGSTAWVAKNVPRTWTWNIASNLATSMSAMVARPWPPMPALFNSTSIAVNSRSVAAIAAFSAATSRTSTTSTWGSVPARADQPGGLLGARRIDVVDHDPRAALGHQDRVAAPHAAA